MVINKEIQLSKEELQVAARLLKVIAHPVKLEILQILGKNIKMDVSSLCVCIGADCENSMMSHHLTKLKDNNIVVSNRSGKQVFYSLANDNILRFLNCMEFYLKK